MKKMKKILALILAMAMVLAMGVTAFAASIKIEHDISYEGAGGTTPRVYNAYKIFDANYTTLSGENTQGSKDEFNYTPDGAAIAYSMAIDSPWVGVMLDTEQEWFNVELAADGSKYVITPAEDDEKNSLYSDVDDAKAFAKYLEKNIPDTATATEVTVDAATATDVLPGYYLIIAKDSKDAVTKVALVTTDVTMVEKNTYITTDKKTSETSYNVGDIVTYTATVTIPSDTALTEVEGDGYKEGHGPIILHDKMAAELTFKKDVTATVDGVSFTEFTKSYDETNGWSITDGDTFELSIPVTSALLDRTITFTYTAELNSLAKDDTGFVNGLFGELNGYKTNPDEVKVWTFDFDFKKTFVGSADSNLTATFELRTDANDEDTAISFITGTKAGSYIVSDSDDKDTTTPTKIITSANNVAINVQGLKAGTYYLVEKTTSTGYNLLAEPVTVIIADTTDKNATTVVPSHTVTIDGKTSTETAPVAIENNAGTLLPSTGGMGTTILYVVGGILVVAAVVLLFVKRRVEEN